MAGVIKKLIDTIIAQRSNGNEVMAQTTKTKMILKGINPDKFDNSSPDDAVVIQKLKDLAKELGIKI